MSSLGVVLLQWRVFWRAQSPNNGRRARVAGVDQLDQAEIHKHDAPFGSQDEVGWFDVAVQDVVPMAVGQSAQHLG